MDRCATVALANQAHQYEADLFTLLDHPTTAQGLVLLAQRFEAASPQLFTQPQGVFLVLFLAKFTTLPIILATAPILAVALLAEDKHPHRPAKTLYMRLLLVELKGCPTVEQQRHRTYMGSKIYSKMSHQLTAAFVNHSKIA